MNSEILNYIEQARSLGQSDEIITQSLLKSGWTIEDIKSSLVKQDIKRVSFFPLWSYITQLFSKLWQNKNSLPLISLIFGFSTLLLFWFGIKIYLKITSGLPSIEFFILAFVLLLILCFLVLLVSAFLGLLTSIFNSSQKISFKNLLKESLKKSTDAYLGVFVFIGLVFAGYKAIFIPGYIIFLLYIPALYVFLNKEYDLISEMALSRKAVFSNFWSYLWKQFQVFVFLILIYFVLVAIGDLILFTILRFIPIAFSYIVFLLQGFFIAIFGYLFFGLEFIVAHQLVKNQLARSSIIEKIILTVGLLFLAVLIIGIFSPFIKF